MALLNFSTAGKEEMDDFSVIPPNDYNVQIVKSEVTDTKAGDGKRLNLQFKILDGEFKSRILFTGLNIVNPSPKAVEISMKELTSICKACGKAEIEDSAELHKIPLTVSVKIKPASGNFDEQNQITKYKVYSGAESVSEGVQETATTGATESAQADDSEMPWGTE